MDKSRIASAAVGLAVVLMLMGCARTIEIDQNDPLWPLMHARYVLDRNCYLVRQVKEVKGWEFDLLSYNSEIPGLGHPELPREVSEDYTGREFGGARIVGVIARGSVVEIVDIRRVVTLENSIPIILATHVGQGSGIPSAGNVFNLTRLMSPRHPEEGIHRAIARRIVVHEE